MNRYEIKWINIRELQPYSKNPRKNKEAVPYVKKSIEQFGFKVPIVIDSKKEIVCGHTRYLAARELHLDEVPCIIADDLTPEQIKAFRLADNKVSEKAEWDFDLLDEELAGIFDLDMSEFGFDLNLEDDGKEAVDDNFEAELPEEPKAVQGQIYILGKHRLMCGDSTKAEDVSKLAGGGASRLTSYRPALQCGLYRKDKGRTENSERQNGRFQFQGVLKRCVLCC